MHIQDAHTRKRHSHLYLGNFASNHGKRLISSILHRLQRSARQNSHHLVRITTHLFRIRHRQRKKIIQHRRIRRRVRWIHPTRKHAQAHFVRQHHPSAPTTRVALTQESRARAAPHPLDEQSPPSATVPWAPCSASNPTQRSRVASSPTVTVAYTRTRRHTRTHRRASLARTDTSRARRPRQNIHIPSSSSSSSSSSFSLSHVLVVYRSTPHASQNEDRTTTGLLGHRRHPHGPWNANGRHRMHDAMERAIHCVARDG